jgi:hypothetical protein
VGGSVGLEIQETTMREGVMEERDERRGSMK